LHERQILACAPEYNTQSMAHVSPDAQTYESALVNDFGWNPNGGGTRSVPALMGELAQN
jgi:hypothetical protein